MKITLKIIGILLIAYFILAYAFPKFVAIPFAAWNSKQVWTEYEKSQKNKLNQIDLEIIGVYEYQTDIESENHLIFIDTVDTKLVGFYFGTEDSSGHGVFHYGNPLLNFKLTENEIGFEIGQRELYETTRNKVYKPSQKPKTEKPIGLSKSHLKYSGKLTEFGFNLNCESEFQDCWQNQMEFNKIYD